MKNATLAILGSFILSGATLASTLGGEPIANSLIVYDGQ